MKTWGICLQEHVSAHHWQGPQARPQNGPALRLIPGGIEIRLATQRLLAGVHC